MKKADLKWL